MGLWEGPQLPLNTPLMKTDNLMSATKEYCDDVIGCRSC